MVNNKFFFSNWNYKFWIMKLDSRLLTKICGYICIDEYGFAYPIFCIYFSCILYNSAFLSGSSSMYYIPDGRAKLYEVRKFEKIRFGLTYKQSSCWVVIFFHINEGPNLSWPSHVLHRSANGWFFLLLLCIWLSTWMNDLHIS